MESDSRIQVIERLKQSTNVLVTVNNNPTIDQLAACIGVTLLLNKLGKHATAVFSGQVPSTIEFLKPEETLEKNTDSLRDFIIALDKSKADKLRYKVEDTMVKIFITPYKTSIGQADLEFSQGDFNVDVVLALGIHDNEQVDQAIMAHGRILHDAVVMAVDNKSGESIGSVNWTQEQASSLCEMITSIADDLQQQSLDEQISTALLTGIVAETERFRNDKTTSVTMSMSSKLMAAGANQQLVATELEPEPEPEPEPEIDEAPKEAPEEKEPEKAEEPDEDDGAIIIDHPEDKPPEPPAEPELPPIDPNEIDIDKEGRLRKATDLAEEDNKEPSEPEDSEKPTESDELNKSRRVIQPPTLGGTLTASGLPEQTDPSTDPLSQSSDDKPLLSHDEAESDKVSDNQTLEQIEEAVHSSESATDNTDESTPQAYPTSYFDTNSGVGDARGAVQNAIGQAEAAGSAIPEPTAAVGSTPVSLDMGHNDPPQAGTAVDPSTGQPQYPTNLVPPTNEMPSENTASSVTEPESPPPVPPPMMPPIDSSSTTTPQ